MKVNKTVAVCFLCISKYPLPSSINIINYKDTFLNKIKYIFNLDINNRKIKLVCIFYLHKINYTLLFK
jgi:hypothetical protein